MWNSAPVASDYRDMDCQHARTLLSASLDGETRPAEEARLADHLGGVREPAARTRPTRGPCTGSCASRPAEAVPDLTAEILAATADAGPSNRPGARRCGSGSSRSRSCQILIALPGLFSPAEHTAHLAAFDLALAAGFLWVAARPAQRSRGSCRSGRCSWSLCAGLAVTDAARGYGETLRAVTHSLAVLGIIGAWLLEAQTHRRTPDLPLAA